MYASRFAAAGTEFTVDNNSLDLIIGQPDMYRNADPSRVTKFPPVVHYRSFETAYNRPPIVAIGTGQKPYTLTILADVNVYGSFNASYFLGVPFSYTRTYSELSCCNDASRCTLCTDGECIANGGRYDFATRTCKTPRYLQVRANTW